MRLHDHAHYRRGAATSLSCHTQPARQVLGITSLLGSVLRSYKTELKAEPKAAASAHFFLR